MIKQKKVKIKISRIKIAIVCLLFLLNGCALLGTVLQLAPLAAIFVYYSAPSELRNNEFACIKTVDYYRQGTANHEAIKTRSEYYICLVNIDRGSVREVVKLPDNDNYNLDKAFVCFKENKICLVLDELKGTWQAELDGGSFVQVSDDKIIPTKQIINKTNYAMLPAPEIKEIALP